MRITHRKITASTNEFDVFMLMGYSAGDAGMESDDFYCYGKFFARSLQDAQHQLDTCKQKYPEVDTSDMYVSEYNEYFDSFDPSSPNFDPFDYQTNEVFNNLDALFSTFDYDWDDRGDEDLPFTSTDVNDLDEVYGDTVGFDEDTATDFDIRWDEKFGEPATEVFSTEDFFAWLEEAMNFE